MGLREADMIEPIRALMLSKIGLDLVATEFTAGYGIADLVGGIIEPGAWVNTAELRQPIANKQLIEVLCLLPDGKIRSLDSLAGRVSFSEISLRKRIVPQLIAMGLVTQPKRGYVQLQRPVPSPASRIVAVEAKQEKWREAILQARRYTHFADQVFVAIWDSKIKNVDRSLLYRHRLGLIGVARNSAAVLIEAPHRRPHNPRMNRYCAEILYGLSLQQRRSASITVPCCGG
jgi:hypothetical protein